MKDEFKRFKTAHGKKLNDLAVVIDVSLEKLYSKIERKQIESDVVLFWQKKLYDHIDFTTKLIEEMNNECNIKTVS